MEKERVAPYGSWKSPITSDLIVGQIVTLSEIRVDEADVYWLEGRPSEGGRNVIVRWVPGGETQDLTPAPFNVRTRVHEYGGAAYTVHQGTIYFSNFSDNRLYRQQPGAAPQPLTAEGHLRYADLVIDQHHHRLICVREDHRDSDREAINTIVAIDLATGEQQVLLSGNDFYAAPRISPDGQLLAWLTWCHPNMPWDGTELWTGTIAADGSITRSRHVAGGHTESIFQPEWSPDGILYFVSDRTGWWNIYRHRNGRTEVVTEMEAEFGVPMWNFGQSTYAFESADRIVTVYRQGGTGHLATIEVPASTLTPISTPYSEMTSVHAQPNHAIFIGASPTELPAVVRFDLTGGQPEVLQRAGALEIDEAYISVPEAIEFPTEYGLTAHALYYPPRNPDYVASPQARPPLIVRIHGGPTSATTSALRLNTQFWTSRGFAVLDVNYGGSTGHGRAYRERLNGQWGVVDVDDAVNGARYLVEQGTVNPDQLAIAGGSAGGYTTLAALTFRDVFTAGASHYGIADIDPFTDQTHKFESRYSERLVAPYPEGRQLYHERSPIHFTDLLSSPMILFQGLDDKIVLPNQAELMVEALRAKELPFAYVAFEGEGHGFRRAENIKRTLDAELYFYSRIFGFPLPEPVEPVPIENLPVEAPARS